MTDRPALNLAVMGAGLIGRRHVARVSAAPDARLCAIIDPSPEARDLAHSLSAKWFESFQAMLADGRPDGIIIATPNQMHVEHGLAAVAAGIPALVEKPLADDVTHAIRLVEAGEQAGVPLLTGHHRRHNPIIARAKQIIDSGRLGRLVSVHAFFWLMKPDPYFEVAWRRKPGAGPVLTNLIHDVDLMRYLCGEMEAVQAFQSNAVRGHEVDETTVATMRFASGALGTANISDTIVAPWSWEHSSGENPSFPHAEQTCLHIGGTKASLSVPRLEIWSHETSPDWLEPFKLERSISAEEDPLQRQITQFVRVIRGEEAPLVSAREGLRTLQATLAIMQAARSGMMVTVQPLPDKQSIWAA